MNKTQRIVLFVYAGLIAVMTLFPPYHAKRDPLKSRYSPIWTTMKYEHESVIGTKYFEYGSIDTSRLFIQYVGTTLMFGGLLLAFKEK